MIKPLTTALAASCLAGSTWAIPALELSSPDDLSDLAIGQAATVDVMLTGLQPGETLDFLAGTVEFAPDLFSLPVITPGLISGGGAVPDSAGFITIDDLGLADALYDEFDTPGGDLIANNGLFFSFDVIAQTAGGGSFTLSFADAIGTNASGGNLDGAIAGSALDFTILPSPEPPVPLVSLSSNADLENLLVGDTFTVEVELSGLAPGDTLDVLAAAVEFDDRLLGSPLIAAGTSVPDLNGLTAVADPGLADVFFDELDTLNGDTIDTDGVFFSFDVTVLAEGAGSIDVTFVDAIGLGGNGAEIDAAAFGDALTYTATVPEPGSLFLCLALGTALGMRRRR